MRVMVAMSGGVDSSVAAGLLAGDGHDVVGVTMRLWGGESDTGCCSVVRRRRRPPRCRRPRRRTSRVQLHRRLRHPRRHAVRIGASLGFDTEPVHRVQPQGQVRPPLRACSPARVRRRRHGPSRTNRTPRRPYTLERGADRAKDQSYVVHMLGQVDLARTMFPIGSLTKDEVRHRAGQLGLRTATKPDSQDVCFITTTGGRAAVPRPRIPFTPARVVDSAGTRVGHRSGDRARHRRSAQGPGTRRRGRSDMWSASTAARPRSWWVTRAICWTTRSTVDAMSWVDAPVDGDVLVQTSAHGTPHRATVTLTEASVHVHWHEPQRRVAPGPERGALRPRRPLRVRRRHRRVRNLDGRLLRRRRRGIGMSVRVPARDLRGADCRRLRRAVRRRQRRRGQRRLSRRPRPRRPGRFLELAVGTGRLAIPLAALRPRRHGDRCERIDARRLGATDTDQRVTTVHGDMVDDLPAGPFDVVFVAFNSLFMLADADRQRACFARRCRRARPGGAFVVEAFVPWDPPRGGPHVELRSMTTDRVVLAAISPIP